jgi:transcriptional regulator
MYTPKHFEENDPQILENLMFGYSFALLVTAQNGTPLGTHLPLLYEATGANGILVGHLARANNHWRQFDGGTEAMAVFQGPHSYISPNWYANDGLVPTWNYATIHAYGQPQAIEDPIETKDILARLVKANETDTTGNWSMSRLSSDEIKKQLKGIVAFRMPIDRLEGKFKMGQNRPPEDVLAAVKGLRAAGHADAEMVAAEMETRARRS